MSTTPQKTMKIAEVRGKLEAYSTEQLKLIIETMYKAIPKALKIERNIDGIICDPDSFKTKKREPKKIAIPNIEDLEFTVNEFIEYADNAYYYAPNMFVTKKERPKWRFVVARFYKDLILASSVQENTKICLELLRKLFLLLRYAENYMLFSSIDPFGAIRVTKAEFYNTILILGSRCLDKRVFITEAIQIIFGKESEYTLCHTELVAKLVEFLKTPDILNLTIEICDEMYVELFKKKHMKGEKDIKQGLKTARGNCLAEITLRCHFKLHEYDKGLAYYHSHNHESNDEIALYIVLQIIIEHNLPDIFVREYKTAYKNGVRPRESLKEVYKYTKKEGKLPERFYNNGAKRLSN